MEPRKITTEELAQKLAMSKKIMDKVDNGDFERGNVNQDSLQLTEEVIDGDYPHPQQPQQQPKQTKPMDVDRIKNSKLPDAIKQAMIEHPIQQITLNDSLDMNVMSKAKKLIQEQSPQNSKSKTVPQSFDVKNIERSLTPIIENIIRKTLDDIIDKKLNQILTAQQTVSINENLVIKVGDHIFKGKITGVKNTK